tara:strand:+ start:3661 stop:6090 length:2430 start_codon:yes stop_codon:yes gene_type:complete
MPADEMEKAGPAEARVSDDDVVDEPSVAEAERCVRLLEAEVVASAEVPQAAKPSVEKPSTETKDAPHLLWEAMAEQQRELAQEEVSLVCAKLREAVALRDKYRQEVERPPAGGHYESIEPSVHGAPPYDPFVHPRFEGGQYHFEMRHGVFIAHPVGGGSTPTTAVFSASPSLRTFTRDLQRLIAICSDAAVNSFCYRRLQRLESRFHLHAMEHEQAETSEQRQVPHRDFYNVRKVDTHVHLAAAMNQKHLLRFIKKKLKTEPEAVVSRSADGRTRTLAQVFEDMGLSPYDLSLDALGMHADQSIFCRFDKFNLKYNPLGMGTLRDVFLKSDNMVRGRYFAELTHELFDDLQESKYQLTEYRISVYGRTRGEWDQLAAWVVEHRLHSNNNRWLIQVPRLYGLYQTKGLVSTFCEMLDNIFRPLFEVSTDPSSHPHLDLMLQQVVGFDCVDDESKPEGLLPSTGAPAPLPEQWREGNPHYAYYCFYLYANLNSLNQLRRSRGLSTFCFRPHAGEAGDLNHLHAAFLTARGINHGINLRKSPSLQYLYYITQIGCALSPLSNNALFLRLTKNPFYEFFAVGLNVSLSTDDPLMFHHTKEPLMEEYCVAKQVWRLSSVDCAEIARNSVLQSSFEPCVKAHWLGGSYQLAGVRGNDIRKTNLPDLRVQFRHSMLLHERQLLLDCVQIPCALAEISVPSPGRGSARMPQLSDLAAAHGAVPSGTDSPPQTPTSQWEPNDRLRNSRLGDPARTHVAASSSTRPPRSAWKWSVSLPILALFAAVLLEMPSPGIVTMSWSMWAQSRTSIKSRLAPHSR